MLKKSKELKVAIKAAKEAGKILMKNYGKVRVRYKEDKTPVTKADLLSEKRIREIIQEEFPSCSFLAEESGIEEKERECLWLIDPLDGTTNYSIQNPFFNVSIALAENLKITIGVVYYPFQRELFYAERGKGAYLNNKKIKVSSEENLEKMVITFCHSPDEHSTRLMSKIFEQLKLRNPKVRQIGAAALELSYVAAGRTGCFLTINLAPWDIAAGSLLVEEAQGVITNFEGERYNLKTKNILASNGKIHKELLKIIRRCQKKKKS